MQVKKDKILFTYNNNIQIKINITNDDNLLGDEILINKYVNETKDKLINNINDYEKVKFKYVSNNIDTILLKFKFNNNISFLEDGAGFSKNEFLLNSDSVMNSFFIFDLYDNINPNNQKKICSNYLTKIGNKPEYLIGYDNQTKTFTDNQLNYLYIPKWFLNQNDYVIYSFIKVSFFNAKTGKIILFYNKNNSNTLLRMYFRIILYKNNNTWTFADIMNNEIIFTEYNISNKYNERINNTLDLNNVHKHDYPDGTVFDYKTGKYNPI